MRAVSYWGNNCQAVAENVRQQQNKVRPLGPWKILEVNYFE